MSEDILSLPPPPADKRIRYGEAPQHFADLRYPKSGSAKSVIVNIHGGFWRAKYDLLHAGHLCAALTAQGLPTVNLEYRRVGDNGGGWPGSLQDIRQALQRIREDAELQKRRIILLGHSAGGQLALATAAHEPVAAAVTLAGVLDLQRAYELRLSNDAVVQYLGGKPSEVPLRYCEADPMQLNLPTTMRQIIIHGSADDIVPVVFSRDYAEKKKRAKEDVRFLEIQGADHFDLIDPRSRAWASVAGAVSDIP
ncbi:MAG TPA: alpha/beta hydrolase [Terriglobales bacterium]|jgi:acetyl esterase/lipase|nr:alpha/beta hydrolase [Terriglobales bacterium]